MSKVFLRFRAKYWNRYQDEALEVPNVAFELPTGSGKTLVGLLIGEFRRVTREERVLYLAPTRQLVQQVVGQAREKYGIKPIAFTGSKREFPASDKAAYRSGQAIAVATYSALFNTNPFFKDAQTILLDDAHAAENYIASAWSVEVSRSEHAALDRAILDLFAQDIPAHHLYHMREGSRDSADRGWVEKIPTPRMGEVAEDLTVLLDQYTKETDLRFPWQMLRGHLEACHLYLNHNGWLLRPFIPPTMCHAPFADANQRIFMSATLGRGGDLERITGVRKIHRLPIPEGWDRQGIGRRFFLFPEQSLSSKDTAQFLVDFVQAADRALVLTPSNPVAEEVRELLRPSGCTLFGKDELEQSKQAFVSSTRSVAVLANRYDGIDLPREECRLLIIHGLSKEVNLQERFIQSRLTASTVLLDRLRTRITQAVGRCTRGATDYAAVCVVGDDFADWMVVPEKRRLFHPELQGEVLFGISQSQGVSAKEMLDNLKVFLKHGEEWDVVDSQILEYRDESVQDELPGAEQTLRSSQHEVDYQYAMWHGDYRKALGLAQKATSILTGNDCQGYRGFWHYMAGGAAWLAATHLADKTAQLAAQDQFSRAASCIPSLHWLRTLGLKDDDETASSPEEVARLGRDQTMAAQLESLFDRRGYVTLHKFERDAASVQSGLRAPDSDTFEAAQVLLGEMLGFSAGNSDEQGAPDPWWSVDDLTVVFESKSGITSGRDVSLKDVRQSLTHGNWLRTENVCQESDKIVTVLVTPSTGIDDDARKQAKGIFYWSVEGFQKWADHALSMLRELRTTFTGEGVLAWRSAVIEKVNAYGMTLDGIVDELSSHPLDRIGL